MKNKILIILMACSGSLLAACNGDHSTRTVRDTNSNTYNVDTAKTSKSNIDSTGATKTTGDAGSLDNSASGGTKAVKDTAKMKPKK